MSKKYTANEWATMEGGHTLEPKKKFEFLRDEITEAKLFRSPTSFKNSDPERLAHNIYCLLYTSPSPRDSGQSRMPSSA